MSDRWRISILGEGGDVELVLDFSSWSEISEEIADQVVDMFPRACTASTVKSQYVQRNKLNKLRNFILRMPASMRPMLLNEVTPEFLIDFKTFIEPVTSTRITDWRIATSLISEACKAAGHRPPRFAKYPWATPKARTPELVASSEESKPPTATPSQPHNRKSRTTLAGVPLSSANAEILSFPNEPTVHRPNGLKLIVIFPPVGVNERQSLDFSDWTQLGAAFAEQLARAFVEMNRSTGCKTRNTRRIQANKLLQFLISLEVRPDRLDAITEEQLIAFKVYLDSIPSEATRGKIWNNATNLVESACSESGRPVPHYTDRPWIGAFRDGVGLQNIMTIAVVGRLLRACIDDMSAVLKRAKDPDYYGP